jgi:uncharacterized protein with FMN-binding domain
MSVTRVLIAITGTVVGLVLLLGFKSHPLAAGSRGSLLPAASLPATGTGSPPTAGAGGDQGTPAPSASTPAAQQDKTIAGQAIQTPYGVVQVQIVLSGSRLRDVSFLQLTSEDPQSQAINSQAGPILLQQTLSAQSSSINGVSGATYTSQGYLQSLQSALDQAHVK